MKDDLPRFPTPMEAFGQGKRKHTSAAYDAVGDIPKPPPQQRFRQQMASSPGPSTPINTPPVNQQYKMQQPVQSAPSTPGHYYPGTSHAMGMNQGVPPVYDQMAPHAPHMAPQQMASQMVPQQMAYQQPRVATVPPPQGGVMQGPPQAPGGYAPHSGTRLPSNPMMMQNQYAPPRPSPPPSAGPAPTRKPAPEPPKPRASETADLRSLFDEVDRKKRGYLTERELSKALVNGDYTLFDAHTVRLMMKMFDRDGDGAIYFAEFGQLWKYLHEWRQVFDRFDTSRSDTIDLDEFNRALAAFGYSLSAPCVQFLFNAGSKLNRQGVREMPFDLFVQSCISIKSITDTFKRYDTDRDGFVTMSFEDYLTETTKLH